MKSHDGEGFTEEYVTTHLVISFVPIRVLSDVALLGNVVAAPLVVVECGGSTPPLPARLDAPPES